MINILFIQKVSATIVKIVENLVVRQFIRIYFHFVKSTPSYVSARMVPLLSSEDAVLGND